MLKSRSPARVWKSFWSLRTGQHFHIGNTLYVKYNWIVADKVGGGGSRHVAPWRRVRTTELRYPVALANTDWKYKGTDITSAASAADLKDYQVKVSCGGGGGLAQRDTQGATGGSGVTNG